MQMIGLNNIHGMGSLNIFARFVAFITTTAYVTYNIIYIDMESEKLQSIISKSITGMCTYRSIPNKGTSN